MILEASKPCEVISLFPADLSPKDDGSLMIYIALDSFSEFLFDLGSTKGNTDSNLLNSIKKLMENEDFNRYNHSFTLVLHKYEQLRPKIEAIIKPYGGTFVVNDSYVDKKMTPILNDMFKHLAKKL